MKGQTNYLPLFHSLENDYRSNKPSKKKSMQQTTDSAVKNIYIEEGINAFNEIKAHRNISKLKEERI